MANKNSCNKQTHPRSVQLRQEEQIEGQNLLQFYFLALAARINIAVNIDHALSYYFLVFFLKL